MCKVIYEEELLISEEMHEYLFKHEDMLSLNMRNPLVIYEFSPAVLQIALF
jgi:hypothetical protein